MGNSNYKFDQILYADDDLDDRFLFDLALKEMNTGIKIQFFRYGDQLLNFLTIDFSPQNKIVFLDFNMPQKNGIECLEHIRADNRLKQLPVVVYSTSVNNADILKSYEAGANLYITKPGTFREIIEILNKVFNLDWSKFIPKPGYSDFVLK